LPVIIETRIYNTTGKNKSDTKPAITFRNVVKINEVIQVKTSLG